MFGAKINTSTFQALVLIVEYIPPYFRYPAENEAADVEADIMGFQSFSFDFLIRAFLNFQDCGIPSDRIFYSFLV